MAYALIVAFMYFAQRSLLFPGAAMGGHLASGAAPWGERVEIATKDGERLAALVAAPPAGRPAAIFFHGNADNVANYGFLAATLSARGFGLLAISYRGYGSSTGAPTEAGLIVDGTAAFDWLAARHDGPLVLVGQSLGAGVAVATAARRPAAGVVLISAQDSVLALARGHYPFLPVGLLIRDPFRSDLLIGDVRQPKLFLHGDRDMVVPLHHGRALFDLAPEPKEFRVFSGYGHNDLWSPDLVAAVTDFLEAVKTNAGAD